eukprot:293127-Amphidinium_carterae.1
MSSHVYNLHCPLKELAEVRTTVFNAKHWLVLSKSFGIDRLTGPPHQRASVGAAGVSRVLAARADPPGCLPGHARRPAWAERQAVRRAACSFLLRG